ncbi:hypothetical protein [Qipengyuania nanhaisediminis]|uniref:hypothetical protein n=1 Tax=Qipengyuania nanhaisediminis TaxID=604088 RepID=UPI0038B370C9
MALTALAAMLAACASGPRGPSDAVIARALQGAPGAAQPSTVVATELAFARAAREDGQWTAFEAFAAPGAMLHTRSGPRPFAELREVLEDPEEAVQWAPRTVVMSCAGDVAVSLGRYRDPEGTVGTFVTVWQRQQDGQYRWIYDGGGPDIPQPAPRSVPEDGDIVVTAMDAVEGLVASCARPDAPVAAPPSGSVVASGERDPMQSRDGTLRWRIDHLADGTKLVAAEYWFDGRWIAAIDERFTPAS